VLKNGPNGRGHDVTEEGVRLSRLGLAKYRHRPLCATQERPHERQGRPTHGAGGVIQKNNTKTANTAGLKNKQTPNFNSHEDSDYCDQTTREWQERNMPGLDDYSNRT
jgi:hypothetical protein